MSILVLVRHGQSEWNLENRFTGLADVPLTKLGEREAWEVGRRLINMEFDVVFTSDLRRARRTLFIILQEIGQDCLPYFHDKALNERDYGELQGMNKDEAVRQFGEEQVRLWRRSYDVAPPCGESLKDTAARILPYFEGKILPYLRRGKNVLVVAHGNSLRSIIMRLENLTKEQVEDLHLETGMIKIYEMDKDLNVIYSKTLG